MQIGTIVGVEGRVPVEALLLHLSLMMRVIRTKSQDLGSQPTSLAFTCPGLDPFSLACFLLVGEGDFSNEKREML